MTLNRGCTYRHRVSHAGAGAALVSYLAATYRHSSPGTWRRRVEAGEVDVDGATAPAPAVLRAGQVITWRRPPWDEPDVPLTFDVVFEDEWLVAIDKPSGLPSMPAGGFLEHTLLTVARTRYPGASPLHRLGRHTSGLILFARDAVAAARLSRGWREGQVQKHYRTLAVGHASWDAREIDAPIGPVPHARLGTVYAASPGGKPSRSLARVVEHRPASTLLDVEIFTGRPHQVRIHMAWAGHPLLGDPLYAAGGIPIGQDPGLPGDGGYLLHASRLAFEHPVTGAAMGLECAPPPALRGAREFQG
jgi:23S rRNA pseudouridine1911/1915/1917 synthase